MRVQACMHAHGCMCRCLSGSEEGATTLVAGDLGGREPSETRAPCSHVLCSEYSQPLSRPSLQPLGLSFKMVGKTDKVATSL